MTLLLPFFSLLACDETPVEPPYNHFVDVYKPTLTVNTGEMPPRGNRIQVFAHAELASVCRELPELRADVNGVPLTRLHGKVKEDHYEYNRDCNVYEFEGDEAMIAKLPPGDESVVTVTDGVTTISLKTKNLLAKPALVVDSTTVAAGAEVVMRWSPGGDVVNPAAPVSVSLTVGTAKPVVVAATSATADAVTFTLPADLTGDVSVDLLGTRAFNPPVLTCTNTGPCEVSRSFIIQPVTLTVK